MIAYVRQGSVPGRMIHENANFLPVKLHLEDVVQVVAMHEVVTAEAWPLQMG